MRWRGSRAGRVFSGLAAAALLSVGCGRLPVTGGQRPDDPPRKFLGTQMRQVPPDFYSRFQYSPDRGYNGTIQSIGSSIDPRTPAREGARGSSRQTEVTGRPPPGEPELGLGGSGHSGESQGPADLGWRARRGYELGPASSFGPYGEGAKQ